MSDVVYANQSCLLAHNGARINVRAGEPWDANDPLVARYPDHFVTQLPAVRVTTDPRGFRDMHTPPAPAEKPAEDGEGETVHDGDDEVPERATAAPGERRATGRRRGGSQ